MKTICAGLCLFIFYGILLTAQTPEYLSDPEALQSQLKELSAVYDSAFNTGSNLLNGKLYHPAGNKFINPFFIDNDWKQGKIWSSGMIFDNVMLKYDINSDYLVYLFHRESLAYPVYLNKEIVKEFTIMGRHFRYLSDFEHSSQKELIPGYYEVLYEGVTKFYSRHIKQKNPEGSLSNPGYTQKTFFFCKKNGKYIRLKDRKDMIKVLNDHEKEIRTFIRKKNIRFSINESDDLVTVFEYYDNL